MISGWLFATSFQYNKVNLILIENDYLLENELEHNFKNKSEKKCSGMIYKRMQAGKEYTDERSRVFRNSTLGPIAEGVSFLIKATKNVDSKSFTISFKEKKRKPNVPLQIHCKFLQNFIARRSRIDGIWSKIEYSSAKYIQKTSQFNLQICITNQEFLLSVNGVHFAGFSHRLPLRALNRLDVNGDIKKILIFKKNTISYPYLEYLPPLAVTYNLQNTENIPLPVFSYLHAITTNCEKIIKQKNISLPYFCILPTKFAVGQCINVEGRVKMLPQSFFINLQNGTSIWPTSIILLHINVRFSVKPKQKPLIFMNAFSNGKWGQSQRSKVPKILAPGRIFNISLYATENSYKVFLNENLVSEFKYRDTFIKVDTLHIRGDIFLQSVSLILSNITRRF